MHCGSFPQRYVDVRQATRCLTGIKTKKRESETVRSRLSLIGERQTMSAAMSRPAALVPSADNVPGTCFQGRTMRRVSLPCARMSDRPFSFRSYQGIYGNVLQPQSSRGKVKIEERSLCLRPPA